MPPRRTAGPKGPEANSHLSASAEPTLAVTPPGVTPEIARVDPNAPTVVPQPVAPGDPTRPVVAHPPRIEEQPAPAKIGRFTVLRELGRGGTGIVYAAYDEQLDRKVAVKLLHSETREDLARARLLREAQAMARLSHPNIVGVHEVGTYGRQIYVAMEFVHGMTLHAWLKRQRRTFPEIAAMFRQAGEGLAAAHDAGLVHRDFKPANVMVGDDGRVRVLDFGLARSEAEPGAAPGLDHIEPAPEHSSAVGNLRSLDASITVTGVMLGTPAYMSPEQFLGTRVDARSDQFAFCVSLFEAAYRERPFSGDTLAELMTAVLTGIVRDVPAPSGVPRVLRPLLLRGLRRRPDERWSSMRELLAALAPFARPPARRAWLTAAGLAAALAGGGVGMAYETGMLGQVCTGGAERVAAVWNDDVRERLAAVAAASQIPQADELFARAAAAFDRYGDAWIAGYTAACEQAGERSGAELDLRMTCLDERRQALGAAVGMFERIDAELATHADQLLADLPRVDACADEAYLRAKVRPPDDPVMAAFVAGLRGELTQGETIENGGRLDEALSVIDQTLALAPANYPALRAELAFRRGSILENQGAYLDARKSFEDAFFFAVESSHPEVVIDAATRLAYVVGRRLHDEFAAKDWLEHAELYAERHGDKLRRARALTIHGALANLRHLETSSAESLAEGRKVLTEALRLLHELRAEDSIDFARALRFHGDNLTGHSDYPAAIAAEQRALELMRKALGPQHPDVGMIHNSLGLALAMAKRLDEARATYQAGLDAAVDLPNQRNHVYFTLWANLAAIDEEQKQFDRAEKPLREAIGVLERSSDRLPTEAYYMRVRLARALQESGRPAEAELEQLLARAEQAWGPRDPRLAEVLLALSSLYEKTGDFATALPFARRTLDQLLADKVHPNRDAQERARWQLARVLVGAGDTGRGLALAREVRAYLSTGQASPKKAAKWAEEIDAFLTKHLAAGDQR